MKLPIALTLFIISFLPFDLHDDTKSEGYFVGGVVPHHALVKEEIENFWSEVSIRYSPDIILLIGPDHNNIGVGPITTSEDNKKLLQETIDLGYINIDTVVTKDHSIQIHLSTIHKLFPNVQVIPLTIRSDATQEELFALADMLQVLLKGHSVFVAASVDFSHNLAREEAEINDAFSLQAIKGFSYQDLNYMNSEYTDSDQSLVLLSETVCPSHDCEWEVYYHGNSEDYIPSYDVTTSYFTLFLTPDTL